MSVLRLSRNGLQFAVNQRLPRPNRVFHSRIRAFLFRQRNPLGECFVPVRVLADGVQRSRQRPSLVHGLVLREPEGFAQAKHADVNETLWAHPPRDANRCRRAAPREGVHPARLAGKMPAPRPAVRSGVR